jgi:AcrR family transcriptional regulator
MARPRRIDRGAVLGAALAIADDAGLEAVTMAAVAEALGVTPMALYRYVANKEDLLDGVVELLLDEVEPPAPERPWDEQLATMGASLRAVARRHPTVFPLLLQLPARTAQARQTRERVYGALRAAGVADADLETAERIVSTLALGYAASEVSGRFTGHSRATLDRDYEALAAFIRAGLHAFVPAVREGASARPRRRAATKPNR